jgi:hypothetical protein
MNFTLPLTPAEEEKLRARALAEDTTPEEVIRKAIEPIFASVPDDENRNEMLPDFGREGPFFADSTLAHLAERQPVKPLHDPARLAGAIPADVDVDAFLEAIYSAQK